mgnify:CR=1 FL=1
MKLYIPKQHTEYQCDICQTITTDIPLPLFWLNEVSSHYCPECNVICKRCHNKFSKNFEKQWFEKGICSNCNEE